MDVLSIRCTPLPETQHPARVAERLPDTLRRGVAMRGLPHASLLAWPRTRPHRRGRCTLETRRGGHEGPSDPQRRAR